MRMLSASRAMLSTAGVPRGGLERRASCLRKPERDLVSLTNLARFQAMDVARIRRFLLLSQLGEFTWLRSLCPYSSKSCRQCEQAHCLAVFHDPTYRYPKGKKTPPQTLPSSHTSQSMPIADNNSNQSA